MKKENIYNYELITEFDNTKSFYGKARIEESREKKILTSYNTKVAEIDKIKNSAVVFGTHSATTLRHIKEFLLQNSFKAETKEQIEADYMK